MFRILKRRVLPETPPLARGRQTLRLSFVKAAGNTPAGAGKTAAHFFRLFLGEKHPRWRGEDRPSGWCRSR